VDGGCEKVKRKREEKEKKKRRKREEKEKLFLPGLNFGNFGN
jgi:hypothetical protein